MNALCVDPKSDIVPFYWTNTCHHQPVRKYALECGLFTAHVWLKCQSTSFSPMGKCWAAICGRMTVVLQLSLLLHSQWKCTISVTIYKKCFYWKTLKAWLDILLVRTLAHVNGASPQQQIEGAGMYRCALALFSEVTIEGSVVGNGR